MYPITLGYDEAKSRINNLTRNGHHSESMVTSVFTAEKTIRRTLRQLIISAGFKNTIATKIIKRYNGISQLIEAWELFDPQNRQLSDIVGLENVLVIKDAAVKRNKLIHGEQVFKLELCEEITEKILIVLDNIISKLDSEYGYTGWTNIAVRKKSALHNDPRVRIAINT